jgi:transposase
MLLDGKSVEYVSESLNVGLRTVEQYLSIISAGDPNALDRLTARGREPTLDSRELDRLRSAPERGPRAHGYTSELWKNGDVQALIKKKFGVCHSSGYVRDLVEKLQLAHLMQPRRRRTEKKRLTINDEALAWVAATLRESPRVHGIDGDNWNNARLRIAMHRRFGVEYSRAYVWEIATRAGVAQLLTRRRH